MAHHVIEKVGICGALQESSGNMAGDVLGRAFRWDPRSLSSYNHFPRFHRGPPHETTRRNCLLGRMTDLALFRAAGME